MSINVKKYAVFLDIDGTLLGSSKEALRRNLDVIQKVRSLGHKVLVNTGRATAYMPKDVDVEKYFDGVVSGAGARIILDREEIFCKIVDSDAVRSFCKFGFTQENLFVLEGIEDILYIGSSENTNPGWIQITPENLDSVVNENLKVEKFTVLGVVSPEITEILGDDYILIQHNGYAEIVQKACTKSTAMLFVAEKLGLDRDRTVAMGDSLNDFDMIESAGIGVAMGNAVPEIKKIAKMITKDVNDAGVASALEDIFNL